MCNSLLNIPIADTHYLPIRFQTKYGVACIIMLLTSFTVIFTGCVLTAQHYLDSTTLILLVIGTSSISTSFIFPYLLFSIRRFPSCCHPRPNRNRFSTIHRLSTRSSVSNNWTVSCNPVYQEFLRPLPLLPFNFGTEGDTVHVYCAVLPETQV